MTDLSKAYNSIVRCSPVKIMTDSTLFDMGTLLIDIDSRLVTAHNSLIATLIKGDMSKAIEDIGVALVINDNNIRVTIDMFNYIINNSSNFSTGD